MMCKVGRLRQSGWKISGCSSLYGTELQAGCKFTNMVFGRLFISSSIPILAKSGSRPQRSELSLAASGIEGDQLADYYSCQGTFKFMSEYRSPDEAKAMLAQFESLARKRRATRHFLQQPIEHELIERLLRTAQWAPSGLTFSRRDSLWSQTRAPFRG
jgi:hypothetical protein